MGDHRDLHVLTHSFPTRRSSYLIATAALSVGAGATSGGLAGGLLSLAGAVGGLFGLPGRATGGNVTGGSAYMVGERGPEIFVPTSSGRVETMGGTRGPPAHITGYVAAASGGGRPDMVKTGREVARPIRPPLDGGVARAWAFGQPNKHN